MSKTSLLFTSIEGCFLSEKGYLFRSAKGIFLIISGIMLAQKVEYLAGYYREKKDIILSLKKVSFCVLQKGTV